MGAILGIIDLISNLKSGFDLFNDLRSGRW